jgi:hypothetical protein
VVRQSERYAGLPALVAKLREIRPLVEWPEAAPAEPAAPPVAAAPQPVVEGVAAMGGAAMGPTLTAGSFAPAVMGVSPPQPAAPIVDPFSSAPAASAPAPRPAPVASPVWPVAQPAPPPPQAGLDPRLLVAVAGVVLLAAVVAYLAGRASSDGASAAAAAGSAEPAARAYGPASIAANTLDRAFHNLARACELPPSAAAGDLVFRRVFERCGPAPPPPRPRVDAAPEPEPEPPPTAIAEPPPPADDVPAPEPRPGRKRNAPRGGGDEPAAAPGRNCSQACEAEHRTCVRRCGPEPTASGEYQGYQGCLGRCLADLPRCRSSCR